MSNRTVLLSIDIESFFRSFGDYGPGIWQSGISKSEEDRAASFWEAMGGTWSDNLKTDPLVVGSVKDYDHIYVEVFSLDDLFEVKSGFYFDKTSQTVYVKFVDSQPWYLQEFLEYGSSLLLVDHAQWDKNTKMANQSYIDNVFADPRIVMDSFSYRQQASKLAQNRAIYDDCTISLINGDGFLDNIREQTIGRGMKVYYSDLPDLEFADSLKDFTMVFNGRVKAVSFDHDTAKITGGDRISEWKNLVSYDTYTLAEYPDMSPDKEGQYKSFIFGEVFRVPCVNVSSESNNKEWHINSVVNGQSQLVAVYDVSEDAYVPISPNNYDYDPATGNLSLNGAPTGELVADMIGPPVTSPVTGLESYKAVDTVLYVINTFQGLPYIDSFFDTEDVEKTLTQSADVGIFVDGSNPINVKTFLDKILSSDNVRLYQKPVIDNEGIPRIKLSMRGLSTDNISPAVTLKSQDMIVLPLSWYFDESSHMTEIAVKYNEYVSPGTFSHYRNNSFKQEAFENTPTIFEYHYQSYANNRADIEAKALERYKEGILAQYRVKGQSGNELEFALLDYVAYTHVRGDGKEIIPPALWRVTMIDIINRSFELSLIEEDFIDPVVDMAGDLQGPYVMFNDDLNANLRGEFQ